MRTIRAWSNAPQQALAILAPGANDRTVISASPHSITCSLALTGLETAHLAPAAAFQAGMNTARVAGCSAVQLDGAATEMRARDLDRSARRDIASIIRRNGLVFTGLDLWIPERHFVSPQHADRAVEAVTQACGLAGELAKLVEGSGTPTVCITLPEAHPREMVSTLVSAAVSAGVVIADHNGTVEGRGAVLGVGLDPASVLLAQGNPLKLVTSLSGAGVLNDARLTDATPRGRMVVGQGRLDVAAYQALLRTFTTIRHVVIDVRDLSEPTDAAQIAAAAWAEAAAIG